MPWLVAIFAVMVFWVPFESITLPISLPINSDLDRFVVGGIAGVWVIVGLRSPRSVRMVHAPINAATFSFIALAVLSIAVNLRQLAWDGEFLVSLKQLSLVGSYGLAYLVAVTTMRRGEVAAFGKLLAVLGIGTAFGTLYQWETGTNLFFLVSSKLFLGATVQPVTSALAAVTEAGTRVGIAGPTLHPLADATLISTAVPFCLCFATVARGRRERLLWSLGLITLLAGCLATGRKTALIVPALSFLVLCTYGPKTYLPYLVAPVVAFLGLLLATPDKIDRLISSLSNASSSTSTTGRTADYSAVVPDIVSHPLFGRGYGSFDPLKYRVLDNQILGWLVEVGVFGTVAYIAMIVAAAVTVHHVARRPRQADDHLMRAVAAASAGFLLTNFLYDTYGFRPAPYCFFFVAAMGAAYCGTRSDDPARQTVPFG